MQSPINKTNTSSSQLQVEKHPYALSSMPDDFGERFHSSSNHQQHQRSKMKANNANGFIHPSSIGNISNDPPDIQHQSSQMPHVSQSMPPSSNNIPDGAELGSMPTTQPDMNGIDIDSITDLDQLCAIFGK